MKKIKVLIVDDQQLIRDGLEMILSVYDHIEVLGTAENGKVAIAKVSQFHPDVILMDIRMPVMDGVKATKWIKENNPKCKVLILTTFDEDEYIFEALNSGANGYLLKDVKSDEIVKGIETAHAGETLLEPKVATKIVRALTNQSHMTTEDNIDLRLEELTARELEIAKLVSQGKSNKEISLELFITEGTVKNHLTKILSKLEVRDRVQLALLLHEMLSC